MIFTVMFFENRLFVMIRFLVVLLFLTTSALVARMPQNESDVHFTPHAVLDKPFDPSQVVECAVAKVSYWDRPLLNMCYAWYKDELDWLITWFKHEALDPAGIVSQWEKCSDEERPLLIAFSLCDHNAIDVETFQARSKEESTVEPVVIFNGVHVMVGKPTDTGGFCFYSPENHMPDALKLPKGMHDYVALNHCAIENISELILYALVYQEMLLRQEDPASATKDVVQQQVRTMKQKIRLKHPKSTQGLEYFYTKAFESNFFKHLLDALREEKKA